MKPQVPTEVAPGVHVVEGFPARCNVYFLRNPDGDGVTVFDAGGRTMLNQVAEAGVALGGITRVVLGHGHTDHRGTAPYLGAPVFCHADARGDAEGSGGFDYWGAGLPKLRGPERWLHRYFHERFWDGGPVQIAGTVDEGEDVAGFEVVLLDGHAPGQIGLCRESDGVALTTDVFYVLDRLGRTCDPEVPFLVYNYDIPKAVLAIRKLADIGPRVCLPGHGDPLTGDVSGKLRAAADRHDLSPR